MESHLPPIPVKRYFTIGEVADLCGVKPHVLRYWEQEFTQLRPMKRRGNRRYYQHHEVLMIRRIRELLYERGLSISGAKVKLQELAQLERGRTREKDAKLKPSSVPLASEGFASGGLGDSLSETVLTQDQWRQLEKELWEIRDLLNVSQTG